MRPPDVDEFTGEMRTSDQREMRGGNLRHNEKERGRQGT